ncbi:MAG: phenylalanine--tRNA ligase subunit beta [Eubacteriales bacterium]|nr:phenylalanine--tRNA ligase subunit beta [Eubacteriales bacterium]
MITPINWIRQFVPDLDADAKTFADRMTLTGSKVETWKKLDDCFDRVVVGEILSVDKHPDADKLVICKVNIGETEPVQIVTAAKNVFAGAKVPVVLPGGYVDDGQGGRMKIKKGKLRGEVSMGMFCSIHELGSSPAFYPEAADDGIYLFSGTPEPGEAVAPLLGLDDVVFEYEITSNRVDCFSIYGLAREAAATFRLPLKPFTVRETGNTEDVRDYVKVEVRNTNLCSRYCARVVKNIKIGPSPDWMRHRLAAAGIRPINNIVDITNYVMEELGQPMHAFDLDKIAGRTIIVDNATTDTFQTLDEEERTLDDSILMIHDIEKPLAIAGIMGGEDSKITDGATTLLFESACFDGTNIRLSSKKIGLRTESSTKFEKGLDPHNALLAVNRACELIEMLGAGEVVGGVVDVHQPLPTEREVPFHPARCNALLGTDISEAAMDEYFKALELCRFPEKGTVKVPTFRQDIEREADLVEEVVRFYGYDRVPSTLPAMTTPGGLSRNMSLHEELARALCSFGYDEIMTYSFEGPGVFDRLQLRSDDERRQAIRIDNPLGEEYSIMRTLPYHGMLTTLSSNYNNRNGEVRLFEFANTYIPKALPLTELPDERLCLSLGMFGSGDFYDLKGVIEGVLRALGLDEKPRYLTSIDAPWLHPGRKAAIYYGDDTLGEIGEVHPAVAENYGIGTRAYVARLDTAVIQCHADIERKYVPVPKFPSVNRDLSFVMARNDSVILIEDALEKYGRALLESYELFDIYEGENMADGKKSVAYRLKFRAKDRTLTDDEINPIITVIIDELQEKNILLRQ